MANEYYAKGEFRTAYLQRAIRLDLPVATGGLKVGDVCYNNSGTLTARHSATLGNAKAAVIVGDFIVAQSNMTIGDGHAKVENRDYKYSDVVAGTTTAKNVAVYKIVDLNDIIVKEATESAARS